MKKGKSQRGGPDFYMTASEAAAALGVSLSTLYSYVSRKGIRTHKRDGGKVSQYLREDVERLQQRRQAESPAKAFPNLVPSSAVTLLTAQGGFYRGISAVELSQRATLEEVAKLLWAVDEDPFADQKDLVSPEIKTLLDATSRYNPLDRVIMLLPALEVGNPSAYNLNRGTFSRNGAHIIRWVFSIAFGQDRPTLLPIHRFIGSISNCGPEIEDIVRRILVLSADQAVEPTTYAVRAVANTGTTPYRCVSAGLNANAGSRHDGARTASFIRFATEIHLADDPIAPINRRLRENEPLPGFGFSPPPLTGEDPRSVELRAAMRRGLKADESYKKFERAICFAEDLLGKPADFALLAGWVSARLGVSTNQAGLIRLSRSVGWIAHAMEQQERPLIRWRASYSGLLPDLDQA